MKLGPLILITLCLTPALAQAKVKVHPGDCNMTSCGSGSASSSNLNGYDSETITPGASGLSNTVSYVAQGPSASGSESGMGAGASFTNSLTGMDSSSLIQGLDSPATGNDTSDTNR